MAKLMFWNILRIPYGLLWIYFKYLSFYSYIRKNRLPLNRDCYRSMLPVPTPSVLCIQGKPDWKHSVMIWLIYEIWDNAKYTFMSESFQIFKKYFDARIFLSFPYETMKGPYWRCPLGYFLWLQGGPARLG